MLTLGHIEPTLRKVLAQSSSWQWLITLLPAGFILLAIAVVGAIYDIDIGKFTRDPAAIGNIHPLSGFLSNLGVLLWSAVVCVCLFTALVARKRGAAEVYAFTMCSAILSAYLTFDDLFMFHDYLVRQNVIIPEKWVFGALGIATLAYLIRFRVLIVLQSNVVFLILGLGLLSMSVAADTVFQHYLEERLGQWQLFFEDGFKWLGIACWCSYYVRTCYQFVVEPDRFAPSTVR